MKRLWGLSRKRKRFGIVVLALWVFTGSPDVPSAGAFWDDVHFYLTYITARYAGFTPAQALRTAIADMAVDYEVFSEPSQLPKSEIDTILILKGFSDFTAKQLDPRWMFHAFRDEKRFPGAIGNAGKAAIAEEAVNEQGRALFRLAVIMKNPGIFLHFLQDSFAHKKYGDRFSHLFNPLYPKDSTQNARDAGLAIGGSVDWLSFHNAGIGFEIVGEMDKKMREFLRLAVKGQKEGSGLLAHFNDVLAALRDGNPAPPGLSLEEIVPYAAFYLAEKDVQKSGKKWEVVFAQYYRTLAAAGAPVPALSAEMRARFRAHMVGPDMGKAEQAILNAMRTAGFFEFRDAAAKLPTLWDARRKFEIDKDGKLTGLFVDIWILAGKFRVKVEGDLGDPKAKADIVLKMPPTMPGESEYQIGPAAALAVGETQVWENVPVGEINIEARLNGKWLAGWTAVPIEKADNEIVLRLAVKEEADVNLEEGWYVLQYAAVFKRDGAMGSPPYKILKTWYAPKKVRSRMKKSDLIRIAADEAAADAESPVVVAIVSGPHPSIPRGLPRAKEEIVKAP